MSIKQMLTDAKAMIGSNYIAMLLYTFIYLAVSFTLGLVAGYAQNMTVGIIILAVVCIFTIPFSVAYLIVLLQLVRGDEANPGTLFKETGKQFKMAWKVSLYLLVKVLIPLILMIVGLVLVFYVAFTTLALGEEAAAAAIPNSGDMVLGGAVLIIIGSVWMILVSLKYTLVYFIKYDNNDMPLKEVFAKSSELMKGSKASYFFIIFVVQLILILIDKCTNSFTSNEYILQAVTLFFTLLVTPFLSVLGIVIYEEKKNETVPTTEPAAEDVEVKIEENN